MTFPHRRRDNAYLTPYAQALRRKPTREEVLMWAVLRRWPDHKFRRQVPIGPFIVDFACFHPRLVIEFDGGQHNSAEGRKMDATRDAELQKRGFAVLRFWNFAVVRNIDVVSEQIAQTLNWNGRRP